MHITPHPADIRQIVEQALAALGVDAHRLAHLEETVLLDQGRYVARSYRTSDYLASWLVEVGILQFYDAHGNMLQTVNLFEHFRPSGETRKVA